MAYLWTVAIDTLYLAARDAYVSPFVRASLMSRISALDSTLLWGFVQPPPTPGILGLLTGLDSSTGMRFSSQSKNESVPRTDSMSFMIWSDKNFRMMAPFYWFRLSKEAINDLSIRDKGFKILGTFPVSKASEILFMSMISNTGPL